MGRNPEEWDSLFEEEAPDCCPVEIYKYLLEVEFREIATESAAIVHDVSVAHFVKYHKYRSKDAVHECRNQERSKHVIQRLRREDALADEFAVSSVCRSNTDGIEYVRHTSREDCHSRRDEHAEESPSDGAREYAKARCVV